MISPSPIQNQVRLPLSVAIDVVRQGIRIRFGRSLVTVSGIMFGIAFLMSILTSQMLRDGLSEESALRSEVTRMMSFLTAETGLAANSTYRLIVCGPLNPVEHRLLVRLIDEGAERLRWTALVPDSPPLEIPGAAIERVPLRDPEPDTQAVLIVGPSESSDRWDLKDALARHQAPLVFTRAATIQGDLGEATVVHLDRDPTPEEIHSAALEARKMAARRIWLVTISLVVTVIGISNAMLMSVTERFREIGTMKCLGALSAFIRRVFLIESGFMGLVGGCAGAVAGALFSLIAYAAAFGLVETLAAVDLRWLAAYLLLSILCGVGLSMTAALYPARVAAAMLPSHALRTNV